MTKATGPKSTRTALLVVFLLGVGLGGFLGTRYSTGTHTDLNGPPVTPEIGTGNRDRYGLSTSPGKGQRDAGDGFSTNRVLEAWRQARLAVTPAEQCGEAVRFIDSLHLEDFPKVLETLQNQPRNAVAALLENLLLSRWADIDPVAAASQAQRIRHPGDRVDAMATVAGKWAARAPREAWEWASQESDEEARTRLLNQVVGVATQRSPQEATALIDSLPNGVGRRRLEATLVTTLAVTDAAAAAVLARQRNVTDDFTLASLATEFGQQHPKEAIQWASSVPGAVANGRLYEALCRSLAASDPPLALEVASSLPAGDVRTSAMGSVVGSLGETDAQAALDLVRQMPNEYERGLILDQLLRGYSGSMDATSALDAALSFRQEQPLTEALETCGRALGRLQPEAALESASRIDDATQRGTFVTSVLGAWSQRDPEAAATYVVGMAADANRDRALSGVVRGWASSAPQEAAAWVDKFPEGGLRETATRELTSVWGRQNPVEFEEQWLKKLPSGSVFDAAVLQHSQNLVMLNPPSAVHWAGKIQDEQARLSVMRSAFDVWRNRDREAATEWLRHSALPSEFKGSLTGN